MKLCVHSSDLAPGLMLGHEVELGTGLVVGGRVVIHSGTMVGDGCEMQDHAVLGKRPRLGRLSTSGSQDLEPLILERNAVVCAAAVIYAGSRIGESAIVGDHAAGA